MEQLETKCRNCDGRGHSDTYDKCRECGGTGWVVTDFGEAVLSFIRRHLTIEAR